MTWKRFVHRLFGWSCHRAPEAAVPTAPLPHVHTWEKWKRTDINVNNIDTMGRLLSNHPVTGQSRSCKECGFEEIRRLNVV